jgi:hypothetical protein
LNPNAGGGVAFADSLAWLTGLNEKDGTDVAFGGSLVVLFSLSFSLPSSLGASVAGFGDANDQGLPADAALAVVVDDPNEKLENAFAGFAVVSEELSVGLLTAKGEGAACVVCFGSSNDGLAVTTAAVDSEDWVDVVGEPKPEPDGVAGLLTDANENGLDAPVALGLKENAGAGADVAGEVDVLAWLPTLKENAGFGAVVVASLVFSP